MKRTVRLNESELKRMISESVKRVLNENIPGGISDGTDIKEIEQAIINAYNTLQKYGYRELPQEAIVSAKEGDNIDLNEEMWKIRNYLEDAMRSLHAIEYYMDLDVDKIVYNIATN